MLPEKFTERMRVMLGAEYDAFIATYDSEAVRAVRVNPIKCGGQSLPFGDRFFTAKIPHIENGYMLGDIDGIGKTPEHHAGMIYVQDPAAMAAVAGVDIKSDAWVADLCAAPGGKSSAVIERLSDGGFLLSNEYVPKRAKVLVGNLERLGATRAMVTSMDTGKIAELYSEAFDLVIVDAPCSGEGMFRKSEEAVRDWSEENVRISAMRQREILDNAYKILKPSGELLYSTCTWSMEEDEETVYNFIETHPDMRIIPLKAEVSTAGVPGIKIPGKANIGIEETRRFYPHINPGEGQYIALMKKGGTPQNMQTILYKERTKSLTKEESAALEQFFRDTLHKKPEGRVIKDGENLYLIQHGCPLPPYSVFMPGVLIGEICRGIIKPSHQFFSAFGREFRRKINLTPDDARTEKYLVGEEIDTDIFDNGWCAITYLGAPLGGGKISLGRVKNHYPKGLRTR